MSAAAPQENPRQGFNWSPVVALVVVGVVIYAAMQVTGLGRPSGGSEATPRAVVTARPTPKAWALTISSDDTTYTSKVGLGGLLMFEVTVKNTGDAINPGTKFQFSEIDSYADFKGCVPVCEVTELFGVFADLPGVAPGGAETFRFEWITKELGVAD